MIDLHRVCAAVDAIYPADEREPGYAYVDDGSFVSFRMHGIELGVTDDGDVDVDRYLVRSDGGRVSHPFTKRHRDAIRAALDEIDRQESTP